MSGTPSVRTGTAYFITFTLTFTTKVLRVCWVENVGTDSFHECSKPQVQHVLRRSHNGKIIQSLDRKSSAQWTHAAILIRYRLLSYYGQNEWKIARFWYTTVSSHYYNVLSETKCITSYILKDHCQADWLPENEKWVSPKLNHGLNTFQVK